LLPRIFSRTSFIKHAYRGYYNEFIQKSGLFQPIFNLANRIIFENEVLNIQNLENTAHILKYADDDSVLNTFYNSSDSDKGHGMLCIINGVSFAIIWENSVYLFDLHSRDNHGNITENDTSVLLKFEALQNVENSKISSIKSYDSLIVM